MSTSGTGYAEVSCLLRPQPMGRMTSLGGIGSGEETAASRASFVDLLKQPERVQR